MFYPGNIPTGLRKDGYLVRILLGYVEMAENGETHTSRKDRTDKRNIHNGGSDIFTETHLRKRRILFF